VPLPDSESAAKAINLVAIELVMHLEGVYRSS
jgi:hypothetical protein